MAVDRYSSRKRFEKKEKPMSLDRAVEITAMLMKEFPNAKLEIHTESLEKAKLFGQAGVRNGKWVHKR